MLRSLIRLVMVLLALAPAARAETFLGVNVERDVVYARPGGVEVKLDAYIPEGTGPFPAVVVIHGGSWRRGTKEQLAIHAFALARAGFAAFSIEYRLAPEHKWPAQIDDCEAAVRWVRENAAAHKVDAARVGAFGYSAGAQLAALLGLPGAKEAQVGCVVAGGTPVDVESMAAGDSTWFAEWLGATRTERPDIYKAASPLAQDVAGASPMLFFHGATDLMVPRRGVERMVERLRGAGIPSDLLVLPGLGHMTAPAAPTAVTRMIAFFGEHLRAGPPLATVPRTPSGARTGERRAF